MEKLNINWSERFNDYEITKQDGTFVGVYRARREVVVLDFGGRHAKAECNCCADALRIATDFLSGLELNAHLHDFDARGVNSGESAHLINFLGTGMKEE